MWLNISSLLLPFHLICITFWSSNKFSLFWTVLHIVHKQRAAGTIWPACYEPWSREHTNEDQFSCCQDAILPDATRQINRTTNVLVCRKAYFCLPSHIMQYRAGLQIKLPWSDSLIVRRESEGGKVGIP